MHFTSLFFTLVLAYFCLLSKASAADTSVIDVEGRCQYSKVIKTALIQGGYFEDYVKVFRQMNIELVSRGLIKPNQVMNSSFDFNENYSDLAKASRGGCIEFLEDGFYDGKWDDALILKTTNDLKQRIRERKDVDLVLAFGTVAGLNFADSSLGVPVMVITPTDAESAGIIGKGEFSNKKNIHVQKEQDRYKSELVMFHDLFYFKKLGIIADSEEVNQLSQAIPLIEQAGKENGFIVERCTGPIFKEASEQRVDTLKRCAIELAQKDVDSVYIPVGNIQTDMLFTYLKPLYEKEIPTFSQAGEGDVARGALLSLSDSEMVESGRFEAGVLAQIYMGKKPEEISQYYFAPLNLALNLYVARLINWKPDFEVLVGVDKVFLDVISSK